MKTLFTVILCVGSAVAQDATKLSGDVLVSSQNRYIIPGTSTGDTKEATIYDHWGKELATRDKDGVVHISGDPAAAVDALLDALLYNSKQMSAAMKTEEDRYDKLWNLANLCAIEYKKETVAHLRDLKQLQTDVRAITTALAPITARSAKEKK